MASNDMRKSFLPSRMRAPGHWSRFALALVLAASMSSCSGGIKKCYPVKGQVLANGQPLAGAMIVFYPTAPDSPTASGVTDGQGRFELSTYNTKDGAPVGDYDVTITWSQLGLKHRDGLKKTTAR